MEIDFLVRDDVAHILIPKIINCMTYKRADWPITLEVGLSCGPTFGQQYEWSYDSKENGFALLGPTLEQAKPKQPTITEEKVATEEIRIEL